MPRPKEKKEPTFRKIEDGMIFISQGVILVGLPTEVETMGSAGGAVVFPIGGKAKGEKYKKIKYDWRAISGSPLPKQELEELRESLVATSGTIVASLSNATVAPIKCKECGNLNLGYSRFCSNCGKPLKE